jgi:hypothetical protein
VLPCQNLTAAVSLHFTFYNFARPHQTLTKRYGRPTTPAMAAGVADHVWSLYEIARPARFKRWFKLTHYPDFRDQLCKALADADFLINILNYNPDDPTQVDDYLLKQSSDPAAKALEGVLDSTRGLFQQTFPQCTSNLDTTKWIIEQLRKLWCGEE